MQRAKEGSAVERGKAIPDTRAKVGQHAQGCGPRSKLCMSCTPLFSEELLQHNHISSLCFATCKPQVFIYGRKSAESHN